MVTVKVENCIKIYFQWLDVTSLDENGDDIRVLQVCTKTPQNDNWVISPFIKTKGARNVDLEIKYTIR